MVVTSSICSNAVHLDVSTLIINKSALFRATNRLPTKTTLKTLRSGGLSRLKQHNSVIFGHISTNLGDKVYILLLNSFVKLHALLQYQQKSQCSPCILIRDVVILLEQYHGNAYTIITV